MSTSTPGHILSAHTSSSSEIAERLRALLDMLNVLAPDLVHLEASRLDKLSQRQVDILCKVCQVLLSHLPCFTSDKDFRKFVIELPWPDKSENVFIWHVYMPEDLTYVILRVDVLDLDTIAREVFVRMYRLRRPVNLQDIVTYRINWSDVETLGSITYDLEHWLPLSEMGDFKLVEEYRPYLFTKVIPLLSKIYLKHFRAVKTLNVPW